MTIPPSTRIQRWTRRLLRLVRRSALEREMDEEMRHHLELETQVLVEQGLDPAEAGRRARVAFGGLERFKEEGREAWGTGWLEESWRDVRLAGRTLRRSPGFTVAATLVLGLGIGATTAMFTLVRAVLLAELPYPDPNRLVRIYQQNSTTNRWGISAVDYRAIVQQQHSFAAVGAVQQSEGALSGAGVGPERMPVVRATAGFFAAVGIRPAAGRSLEPKDEEPGAAPVMIVGHDLAQQVFGDSPAVGRSLNVDGVSHTIVGVLPRGRAELGGVRSQLWPALQLQQPTRRGPFFLSVIGRLGPGATIEGARQDLQEISLKLFREWAGSFQDSTARLTPFPLRETIVGDSGKPLLVLLGAVVLVLFIAVANVTNLSLVRASARLREVAVRTVLGATRGRLARWLATESLIIAGLAGAVGIALAFGALRALVTDRARLPRAAEVHLDARGVGFAVLLALASGVIIAAWPIGVGLARASAASLRGEDRRTGAGRQAQMVRSALVAVEFALALPLLVGAGLLLQSFLRLQKVDSGIDPHGLVTLSLSLPIARYPTNSAQLRFWTQAERTVSELPGVRAAGLLMGVPPDNAWDVNNFDLIDRPVPSGAAQPVAPWMAATSGALAAMGVPLLDGRLFAPGDTAGAPPVVLVSRAWARHYYPRENALGRQLISGGCTSCPPTTIVGVVGDVKFLGLAGDGEAVYEPVAQYLPISLAVLVRSSESPAAAISQIRERIAALDPELPLSGAQSMEERLSLSVSRPRQWAAAVGGFAAVAVTLAALGIFGLLSYVVSQRRREIGVRMALGAEPRVVVLLVMYRGMHPALVGAGLGLGGALLAARWLQGLLFEVQATDPATLAGVTGLLLLVALVACWLPGRGAARISPVEAMAAE